MVERPIPVRQSDDCIPEPSFCRDHILSMFGEDSGDLDFDRSFDWVLASRSSISEEGIDTPHNQPSENAMSTTQEEGLSAWIQCAAAFCVFFVTWGLLNTYGAFQASYERSLRAASTASDISWVGTVQACFIMLGSVWSGPLYDWGHLRPLVAVGSFMVVVGMVMTSFCYQYWQTLLAQGFLIGLGFGCLFTPTTAVIASHFQKHRGLAMGIATSGSTIGGVILPSVFQNLILQIGFGWTTRALALILLILSILPVLGMRMRTKPPTVRRLFLREAWTEPGYTVFAFAFFFGFLGTYAPYWFIETYCSQLEIAPQELIPYLLPLINAGGLFGRIALGRLADKIGPVDAFTAASGSCTVLLFGWIGVRNEASVVAFCILYGFFSAGMITLPPTIIATALCPNMSQFGTRFTQQLVPSGIGLLIGNPIAAALLARGWIALQIFAATAVLICTILTMVARAARLV